MGILYGLKETAKQWKCFLAQGKRKHWYYFLLIGITDCCFWIQKYKNSFYDMHSLSAKDTNAKNKNALNISVVLCHVQAHLLCNAKCHYGAYDPNPFVPFMLCKICQVACFLQILREVEFIDGRTWSLIQKHFLDLATCWWDIPLTILVMRFGILQ